MRLKLRAFALTCKGSPFLKSGRSDCFLRGQTHKIVSTGAHIQKHMRCEWMATICINVKTHFQQISRGFAACGAWLEIISNDERERPNHWIEFTFFRQSTALQSKHSTRFRGLAKSSADAVFRLPLRFLDRCVSDVTGQFMRGDVIAHFVQNDICIFFAAI